MWACTILRLYTCAAFMLCLLLVGGGIIGVLVWFFTQTKAGESGPAPPPSSTPRYSLTTFLHIHLHDMQTLIHSHTRVCVCWHARTHISSRSRTCSASTHKRTHTNRPIVVEGDSDGPRFMMKVLLQGISVNLFRGKEVQQAYKKAIQQLPRVSLSSRQTKITKIALRKPRLKKQNSLFSSPFFLFSHPLPPPVDSSMPTCLLDI